MTAGSSPEPRIPPLPPADWTDEVRAILGTPLDGSPLGATRLGELNLFATLARQPGPFRAWLALGERLLIGGQLGFADRELLILRTAYNCRSPYEWGQHAQIAVSGGIDRAIVDRVVVGPSAEGWEERQELLLRAADELHADSGVSPATWVDLVRHLSEPQLVELPMLVGYYQLTALVLNSLAVQPEPGLEPLPANRCA